MICEKLIEDNSSINIEVLKTNNDVWITKKRKDRGCNHGCQYLTDYRMDLRVLVCPLRCQLSTMIRRRKQTKTNDQIEHFGPHGQWRLYTF